MKQESFSPLLINNQFQSEIYISNRFVHRCIVFVIYEKLKDNSFMANLTTRILSRGTKKYLKSFELSRFLYSLYGTYLDGFVTKWGSYLVYTLTLKNLVPENWKDPIGSSTELALEMILNANWNNHLFFEPFFREEKNNQIIEIKDLINDKYRFAFEQFIKWMFHEEPFGLTVLGTERSIRKVTNEALSEYYENDFLHQNRMLLFLDNKIDPLYKNLIDQFSQFHPKAPNNFNHQNQTIQIKRSIRRKTKQVQMQQSWIFMGFRFLSKLSEEMYPAMLLFNNMLGGQSNSRLYRKAREELGLCYFVASSLPAGVDTIIVSAGILQKNQKPFEEVVQKEVVNLMRKEINHKDLQNAKDLTNSSLISILDHPYQLISTRIESILFGKDFSIQELINRISHVTMEHIQLVGKELYLDCVYVLKGTE